jgi:NitT/TauT family transport system permease protein
MNERILPKPMTNSPLPPVRTRQSWSALAAQFAPALLLLALLAAWQIVVWLQVYPPFIIPPPLAVWQKGVEVIADGTLWGHIQATMGAVVAGLAVGLAAAVGLGYLIAKNRVLDHALSPLIAAFQSAPVVAYAPLLVIWFGSGLTSKIVTSALIVFFPMLMNTVVGINSVPTALRDLMRSMQATRWQTFSKLEVPAAMPVLLGGLKISASLAVIGAVVGEFVNANAGLGYLINLARSQYDTPLVIVAVLALTLMARLLYSGVRLLENRALAWQKRDRPQWK